MTAVEPYPDMLCLFFVKKRSRSMSQTEEGVQEEVCSRSETEGCRCKVLKSRKRSSAALKQFMLVRVPHH